VVVVSRQDAIVLPGARPDDLLSEVLDPEHLVEYDLTVAEQRRIQMDEQTAVVFQNSPTLLEDLGEKK
jgi:hypothetical protein